MRLLRCSILSAVTVTAFALVVAVQVASAQVLPPRPNTPHPKLLFTIGEQGTEAGQIGSLGAIAVADDGNVFVADTDDDSILVFDSVGEFQFEFGTSGSGPGEFDSVFDIAISPGGNLFVAERGNSRVQAFDRLGSRLFEFGSEGTGPGQFEDLRAIAIDELSNIYTVDWGNGLVQVFDDVGNIAEFFDFKSLGLDHEGRIARPSGIGIDEDSGHIFISGGSDSEGEQAYGVRVFDRDGNLEHRWFNDQVPSQVALDGTGNIFVLAPSNDEDMVQVFDRLGRFQHSFGSATEFNGVSDIDIDNLGRIYVGVGDESVRVYQLVPEPASACLAALGCAGAVVLLRRQDRRWQ